MIPFLIRVRVKITVTIKPNIAGIIPAAITLVKGSSKASEAAIVLGLGEMMFPAFPPPIIAKRMAGLDSLARKAIASAIGATVITATSINTPTAVKTKVASAKAIRDLDSPTRVTIVSAI